MKDNDSYSHVNWLLDEGAIKYEDNLVCAERAFVANSVLNWCSRKAKEKRLDKEQARQYLRMLSFFIKKKIDLYWQDGIINASVEKKTQTTNGGKNDACGSVET